MTTDLHQEEGAQDLFLTTESAEAVDSELLADVLGGELGVVLVHKLGAPGNPELAIGSADEVSRIGSTRPKLTDSPIAPSCTSRP